MRSAFSIFAAVAVGAVLLLSQHTECALIRVGWAAQFLWFLPAVALAEWWHRRTTRDGSGAEQKPRAAAFILLAAMALCLVSSATAHPWFYFLLWPPGGGTYPFYKAGLFRFGVAAMLITPLLLLRRRPRTGVLLLGLLVISQLLCIALFMRETGGAPLYRDDHASFLYRLWAFGRVFPRLVFYDPSWNGGRISTFFVSSGTTAFGAALWPVWRWVPMEVAYTPAIAFVFIILLPLAGAVAVRVAGGSRTAAWSGALLALGPGQLFFLWLLHFGTLGASFSFPALMLIAACLYRVLWLDRREWWVGVLLVLSSAAFLAWPAAVIMAVPVLFGLLVAVRQWRGSRLIFLAACGAAIAVLCAPVAMALLAHANVSSIASADVDTLPVAAGLAQGAREFSAFLRGTNPLLVFLGLGGLWFLRDRGLRSFFGPVIVGIGLLAGWGGMWKPQLQLTRAAIPLAFVAVIPASLWLGRLLEEAAPRRAPLRAALIALLMLGGLNTARLYGNRGPARYDTLRPETRELAEWIRRNTPANGRILFAGPTVHAYGGGHVAPLAMMTGREMMACDYYHFSPKLVEYEYPPRAFRRPDDRVFEFCELYNVSHIITYHERWMKYFRERPGEYDEVLTFGAKRKKWVFLVRREINAFLRGRGRVTAALNALNVEVSNPDDEVVLKYNWAREISVTPPAELRPFEVEKGVTLIAVQPRGRTDFVIGYRGWP